MLDAPNFVGRIFRRPLVGIIMSIGRLAFALSVVFGEYWFKDEYIHARIIEAHRLKRYEGWVEWIKLTQR